MYCAADFNTKWLAIYNMSDRPGNEQRRLNGRTVAVTHYNLYLSCAHGDLYKHHNALVALVARTFNSVFTQLLGVLASAHNTDRGADASSGKPYLPTLANGFNQSNAFSLAFAFGVLFMPSAYWWIYDHLRRMEPSVLWPMDNDIQYLRNSSM